MSTSPPNNLSQRSIKRHLLAGLAVVFLVLIGAGGWAVSTELSGAVIAEGQLVVESNVKKIQHPRGGVIAEINVVDGDAVKAGDVLVRLDPTEAQSNLQIIVKQIEELEARQARIEAEMVGADSLTFPADLVALKGDETADHVMIGEKRFFDVRRTARDGQKAQLREQIKQLNQQIDGLLAQQKAKAEEIDWSDQELEKLRSLLKQNLVSFTRVADLARDRARMEGELGQLIASIAEAKGKIVETELRIIQVDEDVRTEAGKELADIRTNLAQLGEKRIAAQEELDRVDIRAPLDGTVHELAVHTVRGVVSPGEPIMLLVPKSDALTVEAKVRPQDIDQLHLGQATVLRFTAFNQRTTPELNGAVTRISPDVIQDPKTGASYYAVRIGLSPDEVGKLGHLVLVPGMPVEAFVQTAPRTMLSYLARPLHDQLARAFREN